MIPQWSRFASYLAEISSLGSPTRFDVGLIEVIMLYPDDEALRARAATASLIEWIGADGLKFPRKGLARLQELTRHACPIETIQEEIKKERYVRGVIAGSFLTNMIVANALDLPGKSMDEVAVDCLMPFLAASWKVRKKTFDNEIWPCFRPVAHFWAASIRHLKEDELRPFPCSAGRFSVFIADAEGFRLRGETLRPHRSPAAVLRPGEAFKLPANLAVEPSEFSTG